MPSKNKITPAYVTRELLRQIDKWEQWLMKKSGSAELVREKSVFSVVKKAEARWKRDWPRVRKFLCTERKNLPRVWPRGEWQRPHVIFLLASRVGHFLFRVFSADKVTDWKRQTYAGLIAPHRELAAHFAYASYEYCLKKGFAGALGRYEAPPSSAAEDFDSSGKYPLPGLDLVWQSRLLVAAFADWHSLRRVAFGPDSNRYFLDELVREQRKSARIFLQLYTVRPEVNPRYRPRGTVDDLCWMILFAGDLIRQAGTTTGDKLERQWNQNEALGKVYKVVRASMTADSTELPTKKDIAKRVGRDPSALRRNKATSGLLRAHGKEIRNKRDALDQCSGSRLTNEKAVGRGKKEVDENESC